MVKQLSYPRSLETNQCSMKLIEVELDQEDCEFCKMGAVAVMDCSSVGLEMENDDGFFQSP
jgi:hypothetical protein